MIVAHYPNPNKPVQSVYVPNNSTPLNSGTELMANGLTRAHNGYYARKHSVSVEEFVKRDLLIRDLAKDAVGLESGKEYYPTTKAAYEARGKCKIRYVLRSYADFDPGTWNDKDYHFIVGAIDKNGKTLVTTGNYFQDKEPTK